MKHLRHPLRAAATAGRRAARYVAFQRFGDRGERHFRGDARYDLENVSRGLIPRVAALKNDGKLLERICTAYNKSVKREQSAPEVYQANSWWQKVRQKRLGPVMRALETHDIDALRSMYRNFFRDPCGAGLVDVPCHMYKAYFGRVPGNSQRRFLLADTLYAIDHWNMQTDERHALSVLAGPNVGNPFGVLLDGTLVRAGALYEHYSAEKICDCLDALRGVVAEIGGGFGGMAYYLLRDRPGVQYLDFDVPESIALTSYYLASAFPHLTFLLYGEKEFTAEALARADVVLMPLFELEKMQCKSVDITFSSHAMSDISEDAMANYLAIITRITRSQFLYMGNRRGSELISKLSAGERNGFQPIDARPSGWHTHKYPAADEVECLYRVGVH